MKIQWKLFFEFFSSIIPLTFIQVYFGTLLSCRVCKKFINNESISILKTAVEFTMKKAINFVKFHCSLYSNVYFSRNRLTRGRVYNPF